MPTQPQTPTPPPGKGPAERRWTAAYNQARQTGDLLILELLDDAWAAAWRESAGTEPGQSREERAALAWDIYRRGQGDEVEHRAEDEDGHREDRG
jgi:hypothetical protein